MKPKETPTTIVARNLALAGMVSQVGCVTIVIVVGALLVGLWLDSRWDTRPVMTIVLLLLSIPVSMYSLVRIALSTAHQFQTPQAPSDRPNPPSGEEGKAS